MAECPWCGKVGCPQPVEHDRMHRASETTWRRIANRRIYEDVAAIRGAK